MGEDLTLDPLFALRNRGDAHDTTRWPDGDPDYVAEFGLTAQHIPDLIALAASWVDEPPDGDLVYGPIHAWRALGQLHAIECIHPLLEMQDRLDEIGDDWYLEEFHYVFGLIGSAAVDPLAAFLTDNSHREFPRAKAASGLADIASRSPECRDRVIAILSDELSRHQDDVTYLNGSLVHNLLDLGAVETAVTIERAFAANAIDPTVVGDWCDVRKELGVPGLGIAPDHSPGWPAIRERLGFVDAVAEKRRLDAAESRRIALDQKSEQDAKRRAKAKRKQSKKDRKRNRKQR